MERHKSAHVPIWVVATLWIAGLVWGFVALQERSFKAGAPAVNVPIRLPGIANRPIPQGRFTLLVAIDLECPCSRATLRELEKVIAELHGNILCYVLITAPTDATRSSVGAVGRRQSIGAMANTSIIDDHGGTLTAELGITTSGHAILYDPDGRLQFQGGITPGRGMEGDNAGESAILDLVLNHHAGVTCAPVFGCDMTASRITAMPPLTDLPHSSQISITPANSEKSVAHGGALR